MCPTVLEYKTYKVRNYLKGVVVSEFISKTVAYQ